MAKSRLALGAIIGAAVGVVAGVLTAPKSGKEVRADIVDKADELRDKAAAKKAELVDKVKTVADETGIKRK